MPLSWSSWAAALFAVVAVWLLLPPPSRALQRIAEGSSRPPRDRPWGALGAIEGAASLPRRILVATAGASAVCLGLMRLGLDVGWGSWVPAPVLVVGGVVALGRLEPLAARRRRHRLVLEVPAALELLSACLAAGLPLRTATRAVGEAFEGPVREELQRVVGLVDLGQADAAAWLELGDHPQLGPAARDLARSVETGTRMVEGLRRHAADARRRREAVLQVQARSVGVRSVLPLMTCFIPSFLLLGVVPTVVSALTRALS